MVKKTATTKNQEQEERLSTTSSRQSGVVGSDQDNNNNNDSKKSNSKKNQISFRFPNFFLMIAILVGMYITIALAGHFNAHTNWGNVVVKACYFHPYATQFLTWVEVNIAAYVFFGYQKIALTFIAPAAVLAHVGESFVAFRRLIAAQNKFGSRVVPWSQIIIHGVAVFIFGFPSLKICGSELASLSGGKAKK